MKTITTENVIDSSDNLCISEDDIFDFLDSNGTDIDQDVSVAREGHELQGIRLRQQQMN